MSGFGLNGGRNRCFVYWQEFSKCYAGTDNPRECRPQVDDYFECLHHRKEIERAQAIEAETYKKARRAAQAGHQLADGTITTIGLIQREKDEGAAERAS